MIDIITDIVMSYRLPIIMISFFGVLGLVMINVYVSMILDRILPSSTGKQYLSSQYQSVALFGIASMVITCISSLIYFFSGTVRLSMMMMIAIFAAILIQVTVLAFMGAVLSKCKKTLHHTTHSIAQTFEV